MITKDCTDDWIDKEAEIDSGPENSPKFTSTNDANGASVISKLENRGGKIIFGLAGAET